MALYWLNYLSGTLQQYGKMVNVVLFIIITIIFAQGEYNNTLTIKINTIMNRRRQARHHL